MNERAKLLVATGLGKVYGTREVWSDVDLSVHSGDIIGITGTSGGGKSSLLNCLSGLDAPTAGDVSWRGDRLDAMRPRHLRNLYRDEFGFVFQNAPVIADSSVIENIAALLPLKVRRHPEFRRRQDECLDLMGLLERKRSPAHELSGGERQRLAMVCLLLKKPRCVFADEPTAALDQEFQEVVLSGLTAAARAGAGVILVSHDENVLERCTKTLRLWPSGLQDYSLSRP